jgi:hypothetical protein
VIWKKLAGDYPNSACVVQPGEVSHQNVCKTKFSNGKIYCWGFHFPGFIPVENSSRCSLLLKAQTIWEMMEQN